MRHARLELTLIDAAIGKARHALAFDDAVDPVALIFVAVGQAQRALAVLFAVFELAFVAAAAVVDLKRGLADGGVGRLRARVLGGGGSEQERGCGDAGRDGGGKGRPATAGAGGDHIKLLARRIEHGTGRARRWI